MFKIVIPPILLNNHIVGPLDKRWDIHSEKKPLSSVRRKICETLFTINLPMRYLAFFNLLLCLLTNKDDTIFIILIFFWYCIIFFPQKNYSLVKINKEARIWISPFLLGSFLKPRDFRRVNASSVFWLSTLSFSENRTRSKVWPTYIYFSWIPIKIFFTCLKWEQYWTEWEIFDHQEFR